MYKGYLVECIDVKGVGHCAVSRHLPCNRCACHPGVVDFCLISDRILVKLILSHIIKSYVIVTRPIVKSLQKVDSTTIGANRVKIKVAIQLDCLDQLYSLCIYKRDSCHVPHLSYLP